jgi:hypothetical protein
VIKGKKFSSFPSFLPPLFFLLSPFILLPFLPSPSVLLLPFVLLLSSPSSSLFSPTSHSTHFFKDWMTGEADRRLQSWAWWQFKSYHDITTSGIGTSESFYDENGNLMINKVDPPPAFFLPSPFPPPLPLSLRLPLLSISPTLDVAL